jgi:hypothetical protein
MISGCNACTHLSVCLYTTQPCPATACTTVTLLLALYYSGPFCLLYASVLVGLLYRTRSNTHEVAASALLEYCCASAAVHGALLLVRPLTAHTGTYLSAVPCLVIFMFNLFSGVLACQWCACLPVKASCAYVHHHVLLHRIQAVALLCTCLFTRLLLVWKAAVHPFVQQK